MLSGCKVFTKYLLNSRLNSLNRCWSISRFNISTSVPITSGSASGNVIMWQIKKSAGKMKRIWIRQGYIVTDPNPLVKCDGSESLYLLPLTIVFFPCGHLVVPAATCNSLGINLYILLVQLLKLVTYFSIQSTKILLLPSKCEIIFLPFKNSNFFNMAIAILDLSLFQLCDTKSCRT